MNPLDHTATAIDLQGLTSLKRQARSESPEAIREVAQQFEALFTQMMLKSMREASLGDGLFDSEQSKLYQGMYDQQIALEMSRSGRGLGFTEVLVRQLGGEPTSSIGSGDRREDGSFAAPMRSAIEQVRALAPTTDAAAAAVDKPAVQSTAVEHSAAPEPASFDTPRQFVAQLWPHAERAARRLGTSPDVLIAQAALETGWGRSIIKNEAGQSSHNLFNIKADGRWGGERASVSTVEYRDGVALRERADFRAYDSFAESFDDYVEFLSTNPRYRQALQRAANPEAYVEELQKAGYATDPSYADKITNIMRGEHISAYDSMSRSVDGGVA